MVIMTNPGEASTSTSSSLNPTAAPFLPAITSLPTLSDTALTSVLDLLFEPTADLHAMALPTMRTMSFDSYDDLISTLRDQLLKVQKHLEEDSSSGSQESTGAADAQAVLHRILGSHPRLGEKKVDSAMSRAEQANLKAGGGEEAEKEAQMLAALNHEYESKFPGLRYVVFVNGRGRPEIMRDMRRRIDRGDLLEEEREGIRAMCDIAADRAKKLLAAAVKDLHKICKC
jgi:2-oxo-4-hydroxy-4-carboxy--5-ureidoimidazoline (OHCU) decarboxylase